MRPIQCFVAILLFLSSFMSVPAQQNHPTAEVVEMMKRLEFLSGQWTGGGWMMLGPGKKVTYTGTETVTSKLDGTVLVVEGLHRSVAEAGAPERVIHNAMGVISFDTETKKFKLQSYLANGRSATAEVEVPEKHSIVWRLAIPGMAGTSRYTIKIDEKGDWVEIGEFSMDGKTWRQFLEMRMHRAR